MTTPARTLNVGVVGLGLAAASVMPAMVAMPHVNLVAGADINPRALQAFKTKYAAKTYTSIEALCTDPDIDTVWVATPNTFHCSHVMLAAERGKHIIVEKPMAISLAEAARMIEAAERHGVQLLCGGSRSSSAVVRKMREVVVSGELGRLHAMTTWSATDWMLRPRRPDELDVSQGGGVVYRQAPHQVDSVRLLAGGKVSSVRAVTGQWMAPRHTAPGFFSALLEFENGACATLVYSAYGYFMASEFFEPGASGPDAPGLQSRIEVS
jgi:predicted dehydrogenase